MNLIGQLLGVSGILRVEQDQVDAQPPDAPVGVRLQHLADQGGLLPLAHAHQQDGIIAGDGMGPERRLTLPAGRQGFRRRPQPGMRIEEGREEPAEALHVGAAGSHIPQLRLTPRARLLEGTHHGGPACEVLRHSHQLRTLLGDEGHPSHRHTAVRLQLQLQPQRQDGIEGGAGAPR